ncbi:MAG: hypothetical protein GX094_05120 [Clostridiales bacterium]|jgi:processive 1,2-diacylglycerol beta-glucosyltransferase|nr:hypothetical protein [Clostridiales bacterium]
MGSPVKEKCNVLIITACYGAGHYQVSNALALMIKQLRPDWNVEIRDFLNYTKPFIKHALLFGYQQVIKHFANGYKWYYQATSQLSPNSKLRQIVNRVGSEKLLEAIQSLSPDIVVCTFPNPAGIVSHLKSCGCIDMPLVTVITDVAFHNQWLHPFMDAYILAADIVAKHLKRKGVPSQKLYVTGIPLRPEFSVACHSPTIWKDYDISPDLFTLMTMGGGCGLLAGIEDIFHELASMDLPMQILAITGTNQALAKKLETIAKSSRIPIRVMGFVDNVAQLMEISDLLLTKAGGVTVFEALAKRLPMIIYKPLPGHERNNARFLLKHNAAIQAKTKEQVIDTVIRCINDPTILDKVKKNMDGIAKPFAARDAASIIIDMAENYRKSKNQAKIYTVS